MKQHPKLSQVTGYQKNSTKQRMTSGLLLIAHFIQNVELEETLPLQFADDYILIANNSEYMARKIQEEYRQQGLEINTQTNSDPSNLAHTDHFTYLDTTGKDDVKIGRRVVGARKMIRCLNGIFWFQEIGKRKNITYAILSLKQVFYTRWKHKEYL